VDATLQAIGGDADAGDAGFVGGAHHADDLAVADAGGGVDGDLAVVLQLRRWP
jgi:hypothetical protein